MTELEEKIGYEFKDRSLLKTALTHSSYTNEKKTGGECYERLEFLGDSILGFTTAAFLYAAQPALPEGQMTRQRAELVCEENLYTVAQKLGIAPCMRLGKGADRNGVRQRAAVQADMVEAIIAAIYLDSDIEKAKEFINTHILAGVQPAAPRMLTDFKSMLQEFVQRDPKNNISYEELEETGPDHDKTFTFRVLVNGRDVGTGTGKSKKAAEQAAAKIALETLGERET